MLVFLTGASKNISFLLNQTELTENVISEAVLHETGLTEILDFTVVERRGPDYLYLACLGKGGKLVIFDCRALVFQGGNNLEDARARYLTTLELTDTDCMRV